MRVACLLKNNDGIHIIDAQNVQLAGPIESAETAHAQAEGLGLECLAGEGFELDDSDGEIDIDTSALDLTAELKEEESDIKVDSEGKISGPEKTANADDGSFRRYGIDRSTAGGYRYLGWVERCTTHSIDRISDQPARFHEHR